MDEPTILFTLAELNNCAVHSAVHFLVHFQCTPELTSSPCWPLNGLHASSQADRKFGTDPQSDIQTEIQTLCYTFSTMP